MIDWLLWQDPMERAVPYVRLGSPASRQSRRICLRVSLPFTTAIYPRPLAMPVPAS